MSYLTLDADRLVRDAVDAYLEDRLRADSGGDCVYATRNSQYRVVEGVVQEASDTSLMGAELVGWLVEELGQPMIEPRWRPFGRAIFVERKSRHVVVTSRTLSRNAIGGNVSPVPVMRRKPSVIPPSPPIPVLRASSSSSGFSRLADGSPTPFRVPEGVRESARAIVDMPPTPALRDRSQPSSRQPNQPRVTPPPSSRPTVDDERPTSRPPPEEATVSADRSSYEDLLQASKAPPIPQTPAPGAFRPTADLLGTPPPTPSRPLNLPPVQRPAPAALVTLNQEETVEIDMSAEVEELRDGFDPELPTRIDR